jgi:hypothetical protein
MPISNGGRVAPQNCHLPRPSHLKGFGVWCCNTLLTYFYSTLFCCCCFSTLFLIFRFSDVILATILATKSEMCGQKFELKIDNVRFVGHPTLLQHGLGQVRPCLGGMALFGQQTWLGTSYEPCTFIDPRAVAEKDRGPCPSA